MNKLEKQAEVLSDLLERFMIYVVQMQQDTSSSELSELNKQEANVIYTLGVRGASIMRELAENLRLHVSTMTGIVDKLIEKKIVERQRSDEDRRIVLVNLTEKGRLAFEQEHSKRRHISLAMLNSLDPREREMMLKLFAKVATGLEETISA